MKVRFDRNALALFDPRNGTKVRLAIGPYTKASRPELVDIKITDFCAFGCTFCYQGSTPFGKHASMESMRKVVSELAAAKVFEVALGGGEPTDHPQFVEILHMFRRAGIVPNFTTKYLTRVRGLWPQIKDVVGAFAYSAETVGQIHMTVRHLHAAGIPKDRVNLHYVMGLQPEDMFVSYLIAARFAGLRVTLLGYKTTGRGGDGPPHEYGSWWVEAVSGLVASGLCPTLSIDTPLAGEFAGRLPVDKKLYHTREGAFSMYVDAVAGKFGASSFDPEEELLFFDDDWLALYKGL